MSGGRDARAPRGFAGRLNSFRNIQRSCSSLHSAGEDACAPMSGGSLASFLKMRARRPRSQGFRRSPSHFVSYSVLALRCFPQARTPALPCHAGETPALPGVSQVAFSFRNIQRSCSSLLSAGEDACAPMSGAPMSGAPMSGAYCALGVKSGSPNCAAPNSPISSCVAADVIHC